jgi:deoxyribodipyrimidine photo-lyase
MNTKRSRLLRGTHDWAGPVILWMSRDQRMRDNWALLFAQHLGITRKSPLAVIFCLAPRFLNATQRQYGFMIKGLQELGKELQKKNIPFFLLTGAPEKVIPPFVRKHRVGAIVADFNPLRLTVKWKESVLRTTDIPFYEVDAHNIVPCWTVSPKQEFAARTFRPRIHRVLADYLDEYPALKRHPYAWKGRVTPARWEKGSMSLDIDRTVREVTWLHPGEKAALRKMKDFMKNGLSLYGAKRNDPSQGGQSDLSPYLHFGQLSAQRTVLEALQTNARKESREAFLEELIVRRELSDNFCYYNSHYDRFDGFPAWAKKTLDAHRRDKRPYLYTPKQFENAVTHDDLWNAAQSEMVKKGKMHGYMRMYWAKKILEWTKSPEEALETAIFLNDRYELDGRDPNGYTGVAWSVGGVHDRAWSERPVFGKIRFMSRNGCKSKFDINAYISYAKSL